MTEIYANFEFTHQERKVYVSSNFIVHIARKSNCSISADLRSRWVTGGCLGVFMVSVFPEESHDCINVSSVIRQKLRNRNTICETLSPSFSQ